MIDSNLGKVSTISREVDVISMKIPSKPEFVSVIRLTVSSIANRIGFNIDDIEDIKVAVAEACTNAIKHSKNTEFEVDFELDIDRICIVVKDDGKGFIHEDIKSPNLLEPKEEGGLGIFIIKSLMDEVEFDSKPGKGTEMRMIKYLGDDIDGEGGKL